MNFALAGCPLVIGHRGAAVDPVRIAALARLAVDGIVTDDPGRAREVLATLDPL